MTLLKIPVRKTGTTIDVETNNLTDESHTLIMEAGLTKLINRKAAIALDAKVAMAFAKEYRDQLYSGTYRKLTAR